MTCRSLSCRCLSPRGGIAVAVWLLFLLACVWLVSRASFTADLSAFLPRSPTQEQQLLVDQLKSGVASRLILIGIEGGDPAARLRTSRELAARLRTDAQFLHIANGEMQGMERDRQILLDKRYLLSPAVNPERFSVEGLRAGINDSLDLLASSAGLFSKALLPRDPTGEFMQLLEAMGNSAQPQSDDGVWVARDGQRALLLARTRAEGADIDGQATAVAAIRSAFQAVAAPGTRLALTGPGPFSVNARATIKDDVTRLSGIGMAIIVGLLLLVYRSPTALMLGLLPVLSGALAGVAAVSLGFGVVHGITLGFGTALIGEAVDYSIYLFMQSEQEDAAAGDPRRHWIATYWPTIRIGVLTSVFGFASLLFSGFPGLAQLGLYAISGLLTAALVTRFVLPHLLPAKLRVRDVSEPGRRLQTWVARAGGLRGGVWLLFAAACALLAVKHDSLWNRELAALSPVPLADQQLDTNMRADLGAPDVRYLVVVTAPSEEAALVASERAAGALEKLQAAGVIDGFESPARYLPSQASQRQRLASLPPDAELRQRFAAATAGLPLRADRFEPFFAEVAHARSQPPLTRQDLAGSSLAEGVDALLMESGGRWTALLPLRASAANQHLIDAAQVRAALAAGEPLAAGSKLVFVDIKGETDRLYAGYLQEAILLSLAGLLAILLLLLLATRSLRRVFRIVAPLAVAVAVVIAGLVLAGQQLTILHLVGMLLVVAVGSNYALFFDQGSFDQGRVDQGSVNGGIAPRTLASLLLATTTTVAGFGILAFSSVPVLSAIGATVGPGAILALVFSAILARAT
ncbi:MMPL family transporter [Thiobacillus sp.]|uniref:MMPL family transporter n=1 Tax=Thiobacillus sp. TaxID=924 RepID=UPI00286E2641|nr:MMPL family transporter [Thiobacillus sp.]